MADLLVKAGRRQDAETAQAYRGYAKETMMRALAATRKRHAHLLMQRELDQQMEQHHLGMKWARSLQ